MRRRFCPPAPPRTLDGDDEEVGVLGVEQVGARWRSGTDRAQVQVQDKVRVADGVVTLTLAAPDGGRLPD